MEIKAVASIQVDQKITRTKLRRCCNLVLTTSRHSTPNMTHLLPQLSISLTLPLSPHLHYIYQHLLLQSILSPTLSVQLSLSHDRHRNVLAALRPHIHNSRSVDLLQWFRIGCLGFLIGCITGKTVTGARYSSRSARHVCRDLSFHLPYIRSSTTETAANGRHCVLEAPRDLYPYFRPANVSSRTHSPSLRSPLPPCCSLLYNP